MNEHDELADEIRARTESLHVEAPSPAHAMSRGRRRRHVSRAVTAVAALVIALGVALPLRALMRLGEAPSEPIGPSPTAAVGTPDPTGTLAFIDGGQGLGPISLLDLATGSTRRLTTQSYSPVSLAWSPDGSLIAVTDHLGEGSSALVLVSTESGKATRMPIDPGLSPQDVDWSPDGKVLAFTDSLARLHTIRTDGSDLQVVPTDGRAIDISFAPSGDQIAFVGDKGGVRVVDLQTGTTRVVFEDPPGQRVWFGPTWSPDGSQLAFSIFDDGGSSINVVNADGSAFRRLVDVDPSEHANKPSWSPDGNWISFEGGEEQPDLYAVAVDDGTIRQLTDTPSDEVGSDWGRLQDGAASDPPSPTLQVTDEIPYPHDQAYGGGIALGAGSVWVGVASGQSNADGSIVRIDPATNEIVAEIPIAGPTFRHRVAATDDSVWVASTLAGVVQRIDPATDTVVASIDVGQELSALAADEEAVWVIAIDDRSDSGRQNEGRLVRIDPLTNEIVAEVPLGTAATGYEDGILLSGDSVWVLGARLVGEDVEDGGDLIRVSSTTNAIEATIPVDGFRMVMTEDGSSIWVRSPKDGLFDDYGESWVWRTVDTSSNAVSDPFRLQALLDGGLEVVDGDSFWSVTYDRDESAVVVFGFDTSSRRVEFDTSEPIEDLYTDALVDVESETTWITTTGAIVRVDS